jgi:hypothetical protein
LPTGREFDDVMGNMVAFVEARARAVEAEKPEWVEAWQKSWQKNGVGAKSDGKLGAKMGPRVGPGGKHRVPPRPGRK